MIIVDHKNKNIIRLSFWQFTIKDNILKVFPNSHISDDDYYYFKTELTFEQLLENVKTLPHFNVNKDVEVYV